MLRRMVRQGNLEQVYDNASSEFRSATGRKEFVEALDKVAEEISDEGRFELTGSGQSFRLTGSPLTILSYQNKSKGLVKADEFVFVQDEGRYRLYNYRYDLQ